MAVVGKRTNVWHNSDNLLVAFYKDQATVTRWGAYKEAGSGRTVIEGSIILTELPTAAGGDEQIQSDGLILPTGALIESIDVLVTKETTGTNANLDLGLVKASDRSTEVDFNGLLAASDDWNAGTDLGTITSFKSGSTEVGALVGTRLAFPSLITASADTADFTAGVVKIRIYYSMHLAAEV